MTTRRGQTHYKYNGVTHTISFTDSSVRQTTGFSSGVDIARFRCDQDCYIVFETQDDADSNALELPAGVTEYFAVDEGEKVSAIRVTTSGTLRIDEMTL